MELKKESLNDKLAYYLCMFSVLFTSYIYLVNIICWKDNFNMHVPDGLLSIIGISLMLIKVLIIDRTHTISRYLVMGIIGIIVILSVWKTHQYKLLTHYMLAIGIIELNSEKRLQIIKIYFYFKLIFMFLVLVLVQLGKVENYILDNRWSLGWTQPTHFGAAVFFLWLTYLYIKEKNTNFKEVSCAIILGIMLILYPVAKLDAILVIVAVVAFYIADYKKSFFEIKLIKVIITYLYPILGAMTLTMSALYNPNKKFLVEIDTFLTQRIRLVHTALNKYGISLIGQKIDVQGNGYGSDLTKKYFALDSAYAVNVISYGVLIGLIFLISAVIMTKYAYKKENYKMVSMMSLMAISNTIDDRCFSLVYNPFFFLCVIPAVLWGSGKIEKKVKPLSYTPREFIDKHKK